MGPNGKIQAVTRWRTGIKLLPEPIMTQFIDAYTCLRQKSRLQTSFAHNILLVWPIVLKFCTVRFQSSLKSRVSQLFSPQR